ncbi:MAG: hypothetical protein WAW60_02380 [Candidatus Saccharimonadales bacterium]
MNDGALFERIKSLLQDRYVKLALITLSGALLIYVFFFAFFMMIGVKDAMTHGMMLLLSLFASSFIVAKYIAFRIG